MWSTDSRSGGARRGAALYLAASLLLVAWPRVGAALEPPHDGSNDVACLDCHGAHEATGFGLLPTGAELEAICKSCHNPTGAAGSMHRVANHVVNGNSTVLDCGACHNAHRPSSSVDPHPGGQTADNLSLVRDDMAKQLPGALEPTVFQSRPDHFAFDDASAPWDGVCQSCHTQTAHHTRDGGASHGHGVGQDCTSCHKHEDGFIATCFSCHNASPPPGYGLAPDIASVVESTSFPVTLFGSHLLTSDEDCMVCHTLANHQNGTIDVALVSDPNGDGVLWASYRWARVGNLQPDWCLECHNDNNAGLSYAGGSALEAWIARLPERRLSEGVNGTMNKKDFYEGMDQPPGPLPNGSYPTYVHAGRSPVGPFGCNYCHAPSAHDVRVPSPDSRCYTCHGNAVGMRRSTETGADTGVYLESPFHQFTGGGFFDVASTHDPPLLQGSGLASRCRACHDVHRISRQKNPPNGWTRFDPNDVDPSGRSSTPWLAGVTELCQTCHATIDGSHTSGQACRDCHTYHGSTLPKLLWFDPIAAGVTVDISPVSATISLSGTPAQLYAANVSNYPPGFPPFAAWKLVTVAGGSTGVSYPFDEQPDLPLDPANLSQSSQLLVSDVVVVDKLEVFVNVPTSWRGVYEVTLEKDGTTLLLQDENGFDFAADLVFWYDSVSGYTPADPEYDLSPGPRKPSFDLGLFAGQAVAGTWTLTVTDMWNFGAVGAIDSWELLVNDGLLGTLTPSPGTWNADFVGIAPGNGTVHAVITGGHIGGWGPSVIEVSSAPAALDVTP